jgi:hypothetical protein
MTFRLADSRSEWGIQLSQPVKPPGTSTKGLPSPVVSDSMTMINLLF